MSRFESLFKYSVLSLVSILAVMISFTANAEEAPPTGYSVLSIEIKPGSQGQFEEFILKFKQAADHIGTVPTWYATSPGVGEDNVYSFASPFMSFGELARLMRDVIFLVPSVSTAKRHTTSA